MIVMIESRFRFTDWYDFRMRVMIISFAALQTIEGSSPIMDLHEIHDFEQDDFFRTPLSSMLLNIFDYMI